MSLEKYPGTSDVYDLDCSVMLPSSVTITGTPTMSFLPVLTGGDALTFGVAIVNTVPIDYTESDGSTRTVAAGKVIQVNISGGSVPDKQTRRDYAVAATFTGSNGKTYVAKANMQVLTMFPVVA
jgi:hypothetical protein